MGNIELQPDNNNDQQTSLAAAVADGASEGGDVESKDVVDIKRVEVSQARLEELGYETVEDLLRAEVFDCQGASAGYYTGVHAKRTLNVGLSEAGRETFREARKKAVADFYSGRLIDTLSRSE